MKVLAVKANNTSRDVSRMDTLPSVGYVGIADVEAGCYKIFDFTDALRSHLKSITAQPISKE